MKCQISKCPFGERRCADGGGYSDISSYTCLSALQRELAACKRLVREAKPAMLVQIDMREGIKSRDAIKVITWINKWLKRAERLVGK